MVILSPREDVRQQVEDTVAAWFRGRGFRGTRNLLVRRDGEANFRFAVSIIRSSLDRSVSLTFGVHPLAEPLPKRINLFAWQISLDNLVSPTIEARERALARLDPRRWSGIEGVLELLDSVVAPLVDYSDTVEAVREHFNINATAVKKEYRAWLGLPPP